MSLTGSSSTWSTFLSDLPTPEDGGGIPGEDHFHRNFVQHCTFVRERDPQRLLARFLRYHDQIIAFVGALDESTGLDTSRCLSSVFWSKAFETVQARNHTKWIRLYGKLTQGRKHSMSSKETGPSATSNEISSSANTFPGSATSFQLLAPSYRCFRRTKLFNGRFKPFSRYICSVMSACYKLSIRKIATVSRELCHPVRMQLRP
jgi:hypothetical protein